MVHITVEIELEQIGGRIGGSPASVRILFGKVEAGGAQVDRVGEGVQETHRVVRTT